MRAARGCAFVAGLLVVMSRLLIHQLLWLPAAAAATAAPISNSNKWAHGWDTAGASSFADFNSPTLLTDTQANDVASKYRVVSLEKCSGIDNTTTEEAIYSTAAKIKAIDPTIKVPHTAVPAHLSADILYKLRSRPPPAANSNHRGAGECPPQNDSLSCPI